jgi:hypothetical protein
MMTTTAPIPAIEAKRIASELEAMGVQFSPDNKYPGEGIWYTPPIHGTTAKKLVKRYRKDTGKAATVYNISGGIILLYGEA